MPAGHPLGIKARSYTAEHLPSYCNLVSFAGSRQNKVQGWVQRGSRQSTHSRSPVTRGWSGGTGSQRSGTCQQNGSEARITKKSIYGWKQLVLSEEFKGPEPFVMSLKYVFFHSLRLCCSHLVFNPLQIHRKTLCLQEDANRGLNVWFWEAGIINCLKLFHWSLWWKIKIWKCV